MYGHERWKRILIRLVLLKLGFIKGSVLSTCIHNSYITCRKGFKTEFFIHVLLLGTLRTDLVRLIFEVWPLTYELWRA